MAYLQKAEKRLNKLVNEVLRDNIGGLNSEKQKTYISTYFDLKKQGFYDKLAYLFSNYSLDDICKVYDKEDRKLIITVSEFFI